MVPDDVPHVGRAILEPLHRVGDGGQGIVYFTDRIKINNMWPVAYKEYLPDTTFDPVALRRMVSFVPDLDEANGRWLCEATSWPAALVLDGSRVRGFLMRRVPDRFLMPWGDNRTAVPAALQYLLNPQVYLNRRGIDLDERIRLRLLEAIADVIARLHSLGIVVGDLSPNNLLVDLRDPACFFIDCDGMRLRGEDVLHQVETPEWDVPRPGQEPVATTASDSYKFGLLAARLFAQDQMGQDVSVLAGVAGELGVLARRSLHSDSTTRPTMGDWLNTLRAVQAGRVPRPRPSVRRGSAAPRVVRTAKAPPSPAHGSVSPPPSPAPKAAPTVPTPLKQQPAAPAHSSLETVIGLLFVLLVVACVVGVIVGIVQLF